MKNTITNIEHLNAWEIFSHKPYQLFTKYLLILSLAFGIQQVNAQCPTIPTAAGTYTVTYTTVGSTCNFTVPTGVSSITVECWGGGGGGGAVRIATSGFRSAAGGGRGGMYSTTSLSTTAGTVYNVTVGAAGAAGAAASGGAGGAGGKSSLSLSGTDLAWASGGNGGNGVNNVNGNGTAGTTYASPGTGSGTTFNGGNGRGGNYGTTSGQAGGGGGGGAGTTGNGGAGQAATTNGAGSATSTSAGGAAGVSGGGAGGTGSRNTSTNGAVAGGAASVIGGGGGGAAGNRSSSGTSTAAGGAGARGEVRITYTVISCVVPSALTYTSNTVSYCANVAISSNSPSFTGDAATSYSVSPALPAGLTLNTTTGVITGTPTTETAAANYTVTVNNACGSTTKDVNITVQSSANDAGAISLVAEACIGSTVSIGNVTSATTGTPASSSPTYKYYWTLASPVSWNLYETSSSSTSTLPTAVTNTPGDYVIARNSLFTCGTETNNGNTVKNLTINALPTSTITRVPTGPQFNGTQVTFTATPTSGTAPYTYAWTTNCASAFITASPATGSAQNFVTTLNNSDVYNNTPAALINVFCLMTDDNGCTVSNGLSPNIYPAIQTPQGTLTRCAGSGTTQMTTGTSMPATSGATGYSGFVWSISPAAAGSISNTGLITWDANFSGDATVSVYADGAGSSATVGTQDSPVKSVIISVTAAPVATITSSVNSLCHGNTFNLGGSVTATGAWTMTLSDGATVTGTGSGTWSKSVAPTTNTTYTISSLSDGCPALSLTGSTTLNLPTVATALAPTSTATCIVNGNNWIHFYDVNGKLIVSINPHGNDLGSVTAESFVDGGAIVTQSCISPDPEWTTAVLARRWHITPTNNLPAYIRFPFDGGELSDLVTATAATAQNPLDDVSSVSDLKLSKYSGVSQDGSWSNNCADGGTILVPAQMSNGAVTLANSFVSTISGTEYVQFSVSGFSEFWLHNAEDPSALPVELTSLSASCDNSSEVIVNWTTASEQSTHKFIVEKSRDMVVWEMAGEVPAAGNSNFSINYTSTDANPFSGVSYYRLIQVDNNGAQNVFGPISVPCSGENEMTVFPNPSNGSFTVEIISPETLADAKLNLTDVTGKVVVSKTVSLTEGKTQITFDGMDLQAGTYLVQLASYNKQIKPVKVLVK